MAEYLSKEEIKQWWSSLERITLEEFAARLGKKIEEEKQTNDLIDITMNTKVNVSNDSDNKNKGVRISSIAERAFERERQISHTPFSVQSPKEIKQVTETKTSKTTKSVKNTKKTAKAEETPVVKDELREEVNVVFKKSLTEREQMVFEYFASNKNKIVYAKDLAQLLDLPRDYVYKYIKNLRAKIEGDSLKNAESGGFILSI